MKISRTLVKWGSKVIPYRLAVRGSRFLLATQGLGWATDVRDSGEVRAARATLRRNDPVIFDVGGNVGEFTAALSRERPDARIFVFEPSSAHFRRLQERFAGQPRIHLFHAGLSDHAGRLELRKETEITGLATLLRRDLSHLGIEQSQVEEVEVRVGAEFARTHGITFIDYLKVDVEGWEMPVLMGFDPLFRNRAIGACQFEFTSAQMERRENFRDFHRFFRDRGYRLNSIRPDGVLRRIDGYDEILDSYLASNFVALPA